MNLPSMTSLQALITVSRTGSVTGAADALSVTQSAISHSLKGLERQLGFNLLRRDGRGVRLTERARHYVAEITPALEAVERASQTQSLTGSLTLNVASGFAANWLAPRLGGFMAKHPGIALRLNTPRGYGDLGTRSNDLYISFLLPEEVPPGATKLMEVGFFPVAAPAMVGGQMLAADVLAHTPLLHLDNRQDWQRWFQHAGTAARPDPGIVFQDLQIMDMAARSGQGVALGDHMTSRASLDRGDLMQVHPTVMPSPRTYWLVPGRGPQAAPRRAFESWLLGTL